MSQESFIYSFVARGTVVLAEYTEFTGNFPAIAAQCLQRLPSSNKKFIYTCDGHTFNFLVEDGYGKLSVFFFFFNYLFVSLIFWIWSETLTHSVLFSGFCLFSCFLKRFRWAIVWVLGKLRNILENRIVAFGVPCRFGFQEMKGFLDVKLSRCVLQNWVSGSWYLFLQWIGLIKFFSFRTRV